MFWSLVLPFQITAAVLAACAAAAVLLAPRVKVKRWQATLAASAAAVLGFVPLCLGINVVCGAVRFGELRHDTAAEVGSPEVARWLPPAARGIDLHKDATGFEARYAIGEDELLAWLDAEWARWGDRAAVEREPVDFSPSDGAPYFRRTGRATPPDAYALDGPHAANGAGFTVWYSRSAGRAYQEAGYW